MEHYKNVKKLNEIIDEIVEICTKYDIKHTRCSLQQIVIIGSKSVGKSSLLENIIKKDILPKGSESATRRPLILQLITNKYTDEEYAEFEHTKRNKFKINEICEEIEDEILNNPLKKENERNFIPITLKMYSPNVINLTLVDMPGLSADVGNQIKKMFFDDKKKENTLILAVTPGNNDLATSDALEFAKEVDPEGERTIAVVTKLDMMGTGNHLRVILEQDLYPLKTKYIAVINRIQNYVDQKRNIVDANEFEKIFFHKHPDYDFLSDQLGIHCLHRALNKHFIDHIYNTYLRWQIELEDQLEQAENKCKLYNTTLNIEALSEMHGIFQDLFNNEVGFYESDKVSKTPSGGVKINYLMHTNLPADIANVTLTNENLMTEIVNTIQNIRGARRGFFLPDKAFENVTKAQIKRLQEPSIRCASLVVEELTNIILYCTEHLNAYPKLREEAEKILLSHVKDCEIKCKKQINISFEVELGYLKTENPEFINFEQAEITVDMFSKIQTQGAAIGRFSNEISSNPKVDEVEKVRIMIDSYLKIVTRNINDTVPKIIMLFVVENVKRFIKQKLLVQLHCNNDQEKNNHDELLRKCEGAKDVLQKIDKILSFCLEVKKFSYKPF